MPDDPQRTRRTYVFELWRAVSAGVLETAGTTFLLLIAVQWFDASAFPKSLVAAGGSLGLLLSPGVLWAVTLAGVSNTRAAAGCLMAGAASFLLVAAWPTQWVFVIGSLVGMATSAAIIPLLTQMYQDNYPEAQRGRLFSRTVMVRIATAALFAHLAGGALTRHMDRFPLLCLLFAAALGGAGLCLNQCPGRPIPREGGLHPLRGLRYARHDRLFRRTLIAWMLLGFANLMMIPLRVEYLANPEYALLFSAGQVALLTSVIPNLARLILSPIWGYLFDHMNFFLLRITLNLGFALGIGSFFLSDSMTGLVAGALIFGISNAGGDVAWSLWVTKFAPPNRVADYMSAHTFLTGARGVVAPACGIYLATVWPLGALAALASGCIVVASLLLVPEIRWGRRSRKAGVLVEEVSE